jgi:DNA repair exonuclease SbcCD ATPase subunit
MHRTANDRAANAEREANVHKTKSTYASVENDQSHLVLIYIPRSAALRNLQSTEAAHKNTTAELQRTRATLQTLRATHQSELKKKEKDIERMAEKWNKISESQTKLASTPAGLRCANVSISDGSESIGKGQSYVEVALEDAERARSQLNDEVMRLRRLVLKIVNQVQALLHQTRGFISRKEEAVRDN